MSARHAAIAFFLTGALTLSADLRAPLALAAPALRAEADANRVGVGDVVTVSVSIRDERPSASDLNASPGFDVIGNSQRSEFSLGASVDQKTVFLWTLRARKIGTYVLAPAFRIGATTVSAAPVRIEVTNDPPKPSRTPRAPDPFLSPFGSLFGEPLDSPKQEREPTLLTDSFALPAPRGANVFLHATIDKRRAVVGEQITHTVFIYERHVQGEVNFNDIHEPVFADFFRRTLYDRKAPARYLGEANVGGEGWSVKEITKSALFPLRAGRLPITAMRLAVVGRPMWTRESETFTIDVSEPPAAGRPPGYMGDVGAFRMRSSVKPREVEAGGSISVTIEIDGTGSVPSKLEPPETADVHWLEPQITETSGNSDDKITGKKTFSYIVRLKKPGTTHLGNITLPYFNPRTRSYETLAAELGDIVVTGTAPEPQRDERTQMLDALPRARADLTPTEPMRYLADSRMFFALAFVPPLGLIVGQRSWRGFRALRDRLARRAASPERVLAHKEKAVKHAKGTPKERMAHAYALLEQGYRARTGGSLRGTAAAGLASEPDLAKWVMDYEALRFAPEGPGDAEADELGARALAIVDAWRKS